MDRDMALYLIGEIEELIGEIEGSTSLTPWAISRLIRVRKLLKQLASGFEDEA